MPVEGEAAAPSGAVRALVLATLAFTACFFAWSIYGPLSPALQKSLGISDIEQSWLVAIPVILGSLMRIPMGLLTDRHGGRRVFTSLMAYTCGVLVVLALWHSSFAGLVVVGFLLGMAGSSFAVGVPFVSAWFPRERQGFALGVYGMGMGGTVLAAVSAPPLADHVGLATPFWLALGLVGAATLGFGLLARDAAVPRRTAGIGASFAVLRRSGRAWALTLFYFLCFGGFVAMFLYLPKLLTGVHDVSKTDAGLRAAGFALVAVVGRPLGGYLSDRIGAARVLAASFAGTGLLALGLSAGYDRIAPLTACCLLLAGFLGLGTGAVFKLVAHDFPGEVGVVTGVVGAAGGLGGFFPPLVMAGVKEATGSYRLGFILFAATAAACMAVLWVLRRPAAEARPGEAAGALRP